MNESFPACRHEKNEPTGGQGFLVMCGFQKFQDIEPLLYLLFWGMYTATNIQVFDCICGDCEAGHGGKLM